ncbi:MAG: hypothetical protein JW726_05850 [Anaerolineales bacterium]|nr:hypothetical protein [Anaerolineales bacterium]
MEGSNPIYFALLCVVRCLVPIAILLGISYLLRRWGFIAKPSTPPNGYEESENDA